MHLRHVAASKFHLNADVPPPLFLYDKRKRGESHDELELRSCQNHV